MTLAATPPIKDYVEDGVTLVHAIPFEFGDATEIACTRIFVDGSFAAMVAGVDYTVSGGGGATGTLTKTSGGTVGAAFRIERVTAETQATQFTTGEAFPATNVEKALDRAMAVAQETATGLTLLRQQSIAGNPRDVITPLPPASSRSLNFMRWAATGVSLVMLSAAQLVSAIGPEIAAYVGGLAKGDPGGNTLAVGAFEVLGTLNIPVGTDLIHTSSYNVLGGIGGADYVADDAVDAAYVAAHPLSSKITFNGRGFRLRTEGVFLQPEQVGAKGDNATNDHASFRELTALGAANGFLHAELTRGATYLAGAQHANAVDSEGQGPFYFANENPLEALGLSSLIVRGNGATMKTNAGLKFGAFNTGTGAPQNFTNASPAAYANEAQIGYSIYASGCDLVVIDDVHYDGNSAAQATLGGTTDDTGIQCRHAGWMTAECGEVRVTGGTAVNFLMDGYMIRWTGLTEAADPKPHTIGNFTVKNVGRNCVSVVGGNQVTFTNCANLNPANAPKPGGGVLGSSPKSCMDIEAEDSVCRNITLINPDHRAGPQGATGGAAPLTIAGDTKAVTIIFGKMVGRTFATCKQFHAIGTRFIGTIASGYNVANSGDVVNRAVFDNCDITDTMIGDTPLHTADLSIVGNAGLTGAHFNNCRFDCSFLRVKFQNNISTTHCKIVIRFGTEVVADADYCAHFGAGTGKHFRPEIIDAIAGTVPATGYYVFAPDPNIIFGGLTTSAANKIKWISASAPAGGYTGTYSNYDLSGTGGFTLNGDGAVTLFARQHARTQHWAGALTAQNVLLSRTGAVAGDRFRIVVEAGATGTVTRTVKDLGNGAVLKVISTAGTGCDVVFDGAIWRLDASLTV